MITTQCSECLISDIGTQKKKVTDPGVREGSIQEVKLKLCLEV